MSMEDVMARISEIEDRIRALWPERAAASAGTGLQPAERIPDGDTGTQVRPFPVALAQAGGSVQVRPAVARLTPPVELLIQKNGAQYGLDPNLIRAVITVESDGNPNTISRKGAKGLMQLMPEEIAAYGIHNPFDPEESIAGGARQLAEKLKLFNGDLGLALAAYNAGSGAVRKYNGIPPFPETQNYVQRVFSLLGLQDSR